MPTDAQSPKPEIDAAARETASGAFPVPSLRAFSGPFLGAILLCALGAIAVGVSPLFVRAADVGPQASAFWRAAFALPLALAWAGFEARRAPARGRTSSEARHGMRLAALGGLFFAGDLAFWHIAILGTTLANATFLTNSLPVVIVALGAWAIFALRPSRRFVLAAIAAAAGAALLLGESASFDPANLRGDASAIITAGFFSAYLLAMTAAGQAARPGAAMAAAATATTAGLAISFWLSGEAVLLPSSAEGWATVAALGVLCQGLGQGAIMTSVRILPAGLAALIVLLEPVTTAALGWLWLGESLSGGEMLGGALALAAIVIGAERRRDHSAAPPTGASRSGSP